MKKVKYNTVDGGVVEIEYDETAPCIVCGFPVISASMGGTKLCPWCDMGDERPEAKEARDVSDSNSSNK